MIALDQSPKHRITNAGTRPKFVMRYEIPMICELEGLKAQINNLLGKRELKGRIVTFGSCFAVNLGKALKERGRNVYTLLVGDTRARSSRR